MKINLEKNLINLAHSLNKPLYAVGGVVRNFLIDGSISKDIDLCAGIPDTQFRQAVLALNFKITAEYKRTGTILFTDGKNHYEYTAFRKEVYIKGEHTPISTEFTEDIEVDCKRRDFKCNAIYYDIKNQTIVDPLKGVLDVKNKVLDTVDSAEKVFCSDGLRLMRLARFAGELDFTPTEEVLYWAKEFSDNILFITPERIYAELKMILSADKKYAFSNPEGHYKAIKILDAIRVLDKIFPDLTKGRNMAQRKDYHKHDVLGHSLSCVRYSPERIRLAGLLHDVGKPFCMQKDGNFYEHAKYGESIANNLLSKLKVDKKTVEQVKFLVREHMVDMNCMMKESKVRKYIVKHQKYIDDLLDIKQSDFCASLENTEICPTVKKWREIIQKMISDGTPFSLSQLNLSAVDLVKIGYKGRDIGQELNKLFGFAVLNPHKNNSDFLIEQAKKDFAQI